MPFAPQARALSAQVVPTALLWESFVPIITCRCTNIFETNGHYHEPTFTALQSLHSTSHLVFNKETSTIWHQIEMQRKVEDDGKVYLKNWRSSKAKALLRRLILDGVISKSDSPEHVYKLHHEFQNFKFKNFKTNLKSLHESVQKGKQASERDEIALANDIAIRGKNTHTSNGVPVWVRSNAATLLEEDIRNGVHRIMDPRDLWRSRDEFQEFPLDKFRDKIYQIERKFMQRSYWLNRETQKNQMKKEVDELLAEIHVSKEEANI